MTNQNLIIASGPIIIENNKVLLSNHGDTDFWKFCGGKMKKDETLQQTAIRRTKEELGIFVEILDTKPFVMHTLKNIGTQRIDVLLTHYLAKRTGGILPGKDIKKWTWLPIENITQEKIGPNIIPALKYFKFI